MTLIRVTCFRGRQYLVSLADWDEPGRTALPIRTATGCKLWDLRASDPRRAGGDYIDRRDVVMVQKLPKPQLVEGGVAC